MPRSRHSLQHQYGGKLSCAWQTGLAKGRSQEGICVIQHCSIQLKYDVDTWFGFGPTNSECRRRIIIEMLCVCNQIWEDIQNGKALEDSSVLSRFLLISFADLKKWSFHYLFAFPALLLDPPATLIDLKAASQVFSVEEVCRIFLSLHHTIKLVK